VKLSGMRKQQNQLVAFARKRISELLCSIQNSRNDDAGASAEG
jgi:hypothetical protein